MEAILQRLRSLRISVTPQRLAILGALESRRDHPTAEQIYEQVRREMPAISFNTVYKTLEIFCQKGLIVKVNPLHEVARYDVQTHHHTHLICRGCHLIVDLDWPEAPLPEPPGVLSQDFRIEHQSLIYWGLCPRCRETRISKEDA
ncbi:MAG: transcriptional repressor [Deltaproteobacteria bacterium]|nr:transcriptional repressor [Deltaproteobacteria bacterium]